MTSTRTALDADWLGACRRAVTGLERLLAATPLTEDRARETGTRGSGGDRTLEIDKAAEDVVVDELDAFRAEGYRFCAVSEERGVIDYGDSTVRVIIDPIDGSLNAKRDALHYALSIAVADGENASDVQFGFVHDFGAREQWWAFRGEGAFRDGVRLDVSPGERRTPDGRLELVGIEPAGPRGGAGAGRDRARRSGVGGSLDRRATGLHSPRARARDDRQHPLPGGGGAIRWDGHPPALARRRRGRGAADRSRGGWPGLVHRLRGAAGGANGRDAGLAPRRGAHGAGPRGARAGPGVIDWILAEKLATYVAGRGDGAPPRADLVELAIESERRVTAYTGLARSRPPPPAERTGGRGPL